MHHAAAALGDLHAALLAEELTIIAGARFRNRFEGSAALPARTGVERWALTALASWVPWAGPT